MRHRLFLLVCLVVLASCAPSVQEAGSPSGEVNPPDTQDVASSFEEDSPALSPEPQPEERFVAVYDRYALSDGGGIFAFQPDAADGNAMKPVEIDREEEGQLLYTAPILYGTSGMRWGVQFDNGSLYTYGYTGVDMKEHYGFQELEVRWLGYHYALAPDGTLYYRGEDQLEPVARGVTQAHLAKLDYFETYYVLYLTEDHVLHYHAITPEGVVIEAVVVEDVADFGMSALSPLIEANILLLLRDDGALEYRRYYEMGELEAPDLEIILQRLQNTPGTVLADSVEWFSFTERYLTVLDSQGKLYYTNASMELEQIPDLNTASLAAATVYPQSDAYTQALTVHLLALWKDGRVESRPIRTLDREGPPEEIPPFVRLVDGDIGVTGDGEMYKITLDRNDITRLCYEKLEGTFERERIAMSKLGLNPPTRFANYKRQGEPWQLRCLGENMEVFYLPLVTDKQYRAIGDELLLDEENNLYRLTGIWESGTIKLYPGLDLDNIAVIQSDLLQITDEDLELVEENVRLAQEVANGRMVLTMDGRLVLTESYEDILVDKGVASFAAQCGFGYGEADICYQKANGTLFFSHLEYGNVFTVEIGKFNKSPIHRSPNDSIASSDAYSWIIDDQGQVYQIDLSQFTLTPLAVPVSRGWVDVGIGSVHNPYYSVSRNYLLLLNHKGEVYAYDSRATPEEPLFYGEEIYKMAEEFFGE